MLLGGWKINAVINAMPQKVATAMGEVAEKLVGATYEPVAYLGSQQVNGINHAVIAEQTIVNASGDKNIVLMKFNEKGMQCNLYAIEPIVEGGAAFGGYKVEAHTGDAIDENALKVFEQVTAGMVGAAIHPIAQLATKVVKGTNVVFLCTVTPVYPGAEASVKLVTVNGVMKTIDFEDVL